MLCKFFAMLFSFSKEQCRTIPAWGSSGLFEGTALKITDWSQTVKKCLCFLSLMLPLLGNILAVHGSVGSLFSTSVRFSRKPETPGSVYNADYFWQVLVLPSFSLALKITVEKFTLEEVNREVFLSFLSNMSYIPFFRSLLDCQWMSCFPRE